MTRALVSLSLAAWPALSVAHDGHGASGSHWHASDVWGFIALAVTVGIAVWFQRRK